MGGLSRSLNNRGGLGRLRLNLGVSVIPVISLAAPVLTRTSSAGAVPVTWDATNAVADLFARLQAATDSGFGTITQDLEVLITADNMGRTDLLFPDFVQPSGTYYLRMRYERDDGVNSDWSNTLTDTIVSATAVLTSGSGSTHQNQFVTVTGTPALSAANSVDVGQHVFGRPTIDAVPSGKYGFSWTIASLGTNFAVGVDSGATAVGAAVYPNLDAISNAGVMIWRSGSGSGCRMNSSDTALAVVPDQVGDEIIVEVDKGTGSNGTVSFYRKRGGTKTLMATKTGLSSTRLARAVIGLQLASGSANFGQSALDLNTGYAIYG